MVHRLAGPRRIEDLKCLIEHLATHSIIDLLSGLRELGAKPILADTNAEDEAAVMRRSSVAVSRATLAGRRRASGLTMEPSMISSVAEAIAARVIQGSATCFIGSRQRT
jgi:hypothetical protein